MKLKLDTTNQKEDAAMKKLLIRNSVVPGVMLVMLAVAMILGALA